MQPLVHFAHGKESGPWGTKIQALAAIAEELGCEVASLDYSDLTAPEARAERLMAAIHDLDRPLYLVGSSMGGWVATAASQNLPVQGLFLMAPAFYFPGYPDVTPGCPGNSIDIVHGWTDDVILYEHSLRFGLRYHASVHLVDDDHRLIAALPRISILFREFLRRHLPGA